MFASTTRAAENRTRWGEIAVTSSVVPPTILQGYRIDLNRLQTDLGLLTIPVNGVL